ncbi:mitochondrial import inner membrane translocase subunit TIM14-3 [Drosophila eugracilis]|uniref:mitochondrial import inner membrane translocase subunit TIM14-3 n=1 Tax=Drosophila eugracilis TaxID=29029 RepID=UPI0007E6000A|nr:mitochondrial import inner membrane translocase subunit TIM14-3 [Drosophila eugracilis]
MQTSKSSSQSVSNSLNLMGIAMACGFAAHIIRSPNSSSRLAQLWSRLGNIGTRRFYSGGFQERMSARKASQILGSSLSAPSGRMQAAHRRVILANHPDRNGTPYLAVKINEAKQVLLEQRNKSR